MDGVFVLNKGKGCTSHDIVYKIKKLFGKKVGHTGTLDPNATGVLPILVGKATGLSKYLINHDKKYLTTIELGKRTDTADVEGDVVEEKSVDDGIFDAQRLESVLKGMIGKQKQRPPMYSAIKVNGKKLYEYARSGKTVDIPEREIEIYDMKLVEFNKLEKTVTFEVFCSKGTYIRTMCESFAEKLGTVGYMKDLCRTMVGDFTIENSITIEELKSKVEELQSKCLGDNQNSVQTANEPNYYITIEDFFKERPSIILSDRELNLLLNGVLLDCKTNGNIVENSNVNKEYDIIKIYDTTNKFVGISTICDGKLKRKIIV